jgi:hypothetical protein
MNRLIIIGNGFDLAHCLATKYEDFLLWYLKKLIKNGIENCPDKKFEDNFICIDITGKTPLNNDELCEVLQKQLSLNELLHSSIFKKIPFNRFYQTSILELENFRKNNFNTPIIFYAVKTYLLNELINNFTKNLNWIDIENFYYQELLALYLLYIKALPENKIRIVDKIKTINSELDIIKKNLIEYLKSLNISFEPNFEIAQIFRGNLKNEYNVQNLHDEEIVYFLNFNYTKSINKYINHLQYNNDKNRYIEIQIHGSIISPESVVFGYGDEMHKTYQEIEDLNENEFFRHIKSFGYLQNDEYQKLISFIEGSDKFDVYVLGHSLGLSDRTLLSEIFNNEKLNQIYLFYYQKEDSTDDYTEKTFEISRHFINKAEMRKKIVPKDLSTKMPQFRP